MTNPTIHESATRLVIEDLALSEAEALDRIVEVETDNRALREVLHESVTMLYRTNVQLDRSTRAVLDLQQALREARAEIEALRQHECAA